MIQNIMNCLLSIIFGLIPVILAHHYKDDRRINAKQKYNQNYN